MERIARRVGEVFLQKVSELWLNYIIKFPESFYFNANETLGYAHLAYCDDCMDNQIEARSLCILSAPPSSTDSLVLFPEWLIKYHVRDLESAERDGAESIDAYILSNTPVRSGQICQVWGLKLGVENIPYLKVSNKDFVAYLVKIQKNRWRYTNLINQE